MGVLSMRRGQLGQNSLLKDEIWSVIFECGSDNSPGPSSFSLTVSKG